MKKFGLSLLAVLALMACDPGVESEVDLESQEFELQTTGSATMNTPGNAIFTAGVWAVTHNISFSPNFPSCGAGGCAAASNIYTWRLNAGSSVNYTLPQVTNLPVGRTVQARLCLEMRSFSGGAVVQGLCTSPITTFPATGTTNIWNNSNVLNWGAFSGLGTNYYPVIRAEYRISGTGSLPTPFPAVSTASATIHYTANLDTAPVTTHTWNFNNTSGSSSALSVRGTNYTGNQTDYSSPTLPNSALPYSVPTASCPNPNSPNYYSYTVTNVGYHWNVQALPAGILQSLVSVRLCVKMRPFGSAPVAQTPTTDPCVTLSTSPWNICGTTTCQSQLSSTSFFNGLVFNKLAGTPQFYYAFAVQGTGALSPAVQIGFAGVSLSASRTGTGNCN